MYADHPILALDAKAGRLIDAMRDPDLQKLAWQKYGFRSGVQFGLNSVADFPRLRSPPTYGSLRRRMQRLRWHCWHASSQINAVDS